MFMKFPFLIEISSVVEYPIYSEFPQNSLQTGRLITTTIDMVKI